MGKYFIGYIKLKYSYFNCVYFVEIEQRESRSSEDHRTSDSQT